MVMAKKWKYTVTEDLTTADGGIQEIKIALGDTKDDIICALVNVIMERNEPAGIRVRYPDRSFYGWGTLDPDN